MACMPVVHANVCSNSVTSSVCVSVQLLHENITKEHTLHKRKSLQSKQNLWGKTEFRQVTALTILLVMSSGLNIMFSNCANYNEDS